MNNLRADLKLVADWIPQHSHILDLGCGDAQLLEWLSEHKAVSGYGVEIDNVNVVQAIRRGVNIIQRDLEEGLAEFADHAFDCVVLSQTIQSMRHTENILNEMLRVGKEAIVTFPNFGYWRNRIQILQGHMPVSETIPYQWYNTPNIHWCMLGDFEALCDKNDVKVIERVVMDNGKQVRFLPNLLGSLAFYRVAKKNLDNQNETRCQYCQPFQYIKISSPPDLNKAITLLKKAVKNGTLHVEAHGDGADSFDELAQDHWNDSVSNYFSCSHCGQCFHLHAETYHGSGGALEAINKSDSI